MNLLLRSRRRFVVFAISGTALLAAMSCSSAPGPGAPGRGNTLTQDFVLSPDGRIVAFGLGRKGIGLYDWRTGEIDIVPPPAGVNHTMWVGYSPDGSKLAAVTVMPKDPINNPRGLGLYRLAVFDLTSRQTALFEVPERVFSNTVFRPDGRGILYAARGRLFLFDIGKKTSRALLSEQDRFFHIASPSFVANDTVLFVAIGPRNPQLKATIEGWGGNSVAGPIPYLLKVGSPPEIAFPDFVRRQLADRHGGLPSLMPASRNGERIVFINPSQSERARKLHGTGALPYDLFSIEGGRVRQVTHLENYMAFDAISYDGSMAAFGIYPGSHSGIRGMRRGTIPLELAIIDLNTGQVTHTDFSARVAAELRSDAPRL